MDLMLLLPVLVFISLFTVEYTLWRNKNDHKWVRKLCLTLFFVGGIPALLMLCYVFFAGDRIMPEVVDEHTDGLVATTDTYISGFVCVVLPVTLYIIVRKVIK
ncbi:hypothetical protein ACTHGU_10015 [Chitinophagaceae bacterium MMS25-I14]